VKCEDVEAAPRRCGAHARTTGNPCRRWPLAGRTRCRLHGGRSFGPPPGSQNNLKNGAWLPEAVETRRRQRAEAKAVARAAEHAIAEIEKAAVPPKRRGRKPALNTDGGRVHPVRPPKKVKHDARP
jgi:hypothetical protein